MATSDGPVCGFCKRGRAAESVCGPMHSVNDGKMKIAAHHKCMQYSALLIQYKAEEFGGFKPDKVKSEIYRGRGLKCAICKGDKKSKLSKSGATAGCALAKCNKTFHFYCAHEHPKTITKRASVSFKNNDKKTVIYRVFCSEAHQTKYFKNLLEDKEDMPQNNQETSSSSSGSDADGEDNDMFDDYDKAQPYKSTAPSKGGLLDPSEDSDTVELSRTEIFRRLSYSGADPDGKKLVKNGKRKADNFQSNQSFREEFSELHSPHVNNDSDSTIEMCMDSKKKCTENGKHSAGNLKSSTSGPMRCLELRLEKVSDEGLHSSTSSPMSENEPPSDKLGALCIPNSLDDSNTDVDKLRKIVARRYNLLPCNVFMWHHLINIPSSFTNDLLPCYMSEVTENIISDDSSTILEKLLRPDESGCIRVCKKMVKFNKTFDKEMQAQLEDGLWQKVTNNLRQAEEQCQCPVGAVINTGMHGLRRILVLLLIDKMDPEQEIFTAFKEQYKLCNVFTWSAETRIGSTPQSAAYSISKECQVLRQWFSSSLANLTVTRLPVDQQLLCVAEKDSVSSRLYENVMGQYLMNSSKCESRIVCIYSIDEDVLNYAAFLDKVITKYTAELKETCISNLVFAIEISEKLRDMLTVEAVTKMTQLCGSGDYDVNIHTAWDPDTMPVTCLILEITPSVYRIMREPKHWAPE